MITAYDAIFAKLFDDIVDIILVGDSLNMSFGGQNDTVNIEIDTMIYHTKAVCAGASNPLIVTDMPFGSYYNEEVALQNAIKVYQQTSANAVKIEGGESKSHIIKHLTSNSIAVMAHIGLLPQYSRSEGGYKVKGKTKEDIEQLIKDAIAVEKAGAFCVVIEGVSSNATKEIIKHISIPTIGIGAGKDTDGQVLVFSDMLGLFEDFKPKFVKQYLDGAKLIKNAVQSYANDIQDGSFPSSNYEYK
jgi:3-methyl-2-oxobutanoate hydroxymethyltransferase